PETVSSRRIPHAAAMPPARTAAAMRCGAVSSNILLLLLLLHAPAPTPACSCSYSCLLLLLLHIIRHLESPSSYSPTRGPGVGAGLVLRETKRLPERSYRQVRSTAT